MRTIVAVAAIVFLLLAIMLVAFPTTVPAAWIYQHVAFGLGRGHVGEPMRQFKVGLICGAIAVALFIYRWRGF